MTTTALPEVKLCYAPEVYLISKPVISAPDLFAFLKSIGAETWVSDSPTFGDELPEIAGRLCYLSYTAPRPGGNKAYLERIKESRHGSVLEHVNYGFIFAGISRSLSHELVRHRAGFGFSQVSQRYVDSREVRFVVPPELQEEVKAFEAKRAVQPPSREPEELEGPPVSIGRLWWNGCYGALLNYTALTDYLLDKIEKRMIAQGEREKVNKTELRKAARQAARSVLPNCTETKMAVTGNARAWRHFLEQRCSRHADAEIRALAYAAYGQLMGLAPNLFGDYEVRSLPDGGHELFTPHTKV